MSVVGWDADPALVSWPGLPALTDTITADACVVGLGGSGLAAIEELTSRGLTVVGLDAGRVAHAAAGRNGGFLAGGGAMSLASRDGTVEQALKADLYRATMAELERLAEQLGPKVIRRSGLIRVAGLPGGDGGDEEEAERARELRHCQAELAALKAIGVRASEYDGELGRGYFNPDAAVMNPVRRAFGLASSFPSSVHLFENSRVTSVTAGRVETERGAVHAGVVIVAVDGRLDLLLPQLAPAVRTVRLQMLATEPVAERRLPTGVSFRWGYEWAQQDAEGRLLLGGGRDLFREAEETSEDQPTEPVQAWIESVATRLAGRSVTVTHRWAASVGYTDDGRALCMPVDEGVVACGGYSGSGNLVGPVAARTAVAAALDRAVPPGYFRSSL